MAAVITVPATQMNLPLLCRDLRDRRGFPVQLGLRDRAVNAGRWAPKVSRGILGVLDFRGPEDQPDQPGQEDFREYAETQAPKAILAPWESRAFREIPDR